MARVGICGDFKAGPVAIQDNYPAHRYLEQVLTPVVLPFIQQQLRGKSSLQDNARPHTARQTRHFLNNMNVNIWPWPTYVLLA